MLVREADPAKLAKLAMTFAACKDRAEEHQVTGWIYIVCQTAHGAVKDAADQEQHEEHEEHDDMDHEEHEEAELDEDGGLRGFVRGGIVLCLCSDRSHLYL